LELKTAIAAIKGRWDVRTLTANVEGGGNIDIRMLPLPNQPGRKKLTIHIEQLGRVLSAMGLYANIAGGKLEGEITYDTPDVGGGLLRITDFELKNPPVFVQLLNMLSLEQLLAGTNTTLVKSATIPV